MGRGPGQSGPSFTFENGKGEGFIIWKKKEIFSRLRKLRRIIRQTAISEFSYDSYKLYKKLSNRLKAEIETGSKTEIRVKSRKLSFSLFSRFPVSFLIFSGVPKTGSAEIKPEIDLK